MQDVRAAAGLAGTAAVTLTLLMLQLWFDGVAVIAA
jgi:hypothetical protein